MSEKAKESGLLSVGVVLAILSAIAVPTTWILALLDTWRSDAPLVGKIFVTVTIDGLMAAVWPVTWAYWLLAHFMGWQTALSRATGW